MKTILISVVLSFLLIPLILFSQVELNINHDKTDIGYNYVSNKKISCNLMKLNRDIYSIYCNSYKDQISILLGQKNRRGKWLDKPGILLQYSLLNRKTIWAKELYYLQTDLHFYNDFILENSNNTTNYLDLLTGEIKQSFNNQIYYTDECNKIAIGYSLRPFNKNSNDLQGVDLLSGEILWEEIIDREYRWNELINLNNSLLMIVSSGINILNIKTGKVWAYYTKTGGKDHTKMIVENTAGLAFGIMTGTYMSSVSSPDVVTDIVSNILINDEFFYIASKESIAKLDTNGNVIWTNALPRKHTSKSYIFIDNDRLYLINCGYAYLNNNQIEKGKVFFACYNIETGDEIYFQYPENKMNYISDFYTQSNELTLISNNIISTYDLNKGEKISEKGFLNNTGCFLYLINNDIFIVQDSFYFPLKDVYPAKYHIYTSKNKILAINENFEIIKEIPFENTFSLYFEAGEKMFLSPNDKNIVLEGEVFEKQIEVDGKLKPYSNDKTIVINSDYFKTAELNINSDWFIIRDKIYTYKNDSVVEINIYDL